MKLSFDSKLMSVEQKVMESMMVQTKCESRLCNVEQHQQDTTAVKTNFESRLSSIEVDLNSTCTSLSHVCDLVGELHDGAKVHANHENRLLHLEALTRDTTAIVKGSFEGIKEAQHEACLADLNVSFEHRLSTAESNLNLFAVILKDVDERLLNIGHKLSNKVANGLQLAGIENMMMSQKGSESIANTGAVSKTMRDATASLARTCVNLGIGTQIHSNAQLASCKCSSASGTCYPIVEDNI